MTRALDTADIEPASVGIGRRVHMLMWKQGVSQVSFAQRVGIERTLLGKKLRGIRPWYAEEVVAAAAELGTSVASLYGEAPTPPMLPRLDSNQQPSDKPLKLVSLGVPTRAESVSRPVTPEIAPVIPLGPRRAADPRSAGRRADTSSAA